MHGRLFPAQDSHNIHRENNRRQGVLRGRKLEEAKWCRCSKQKKKKEVVACSKERKAQ